MNENELDVMSPTGKVYGRPDCNNFRTKDCSACLLKGYCGPECQIGDWKIHRILCAMPEVKKEISKFTGHAESKRGTAAEIRILEYCLSFAGHQFGDQIWYRVGEDISSVE